MWSSREREEGVCVIDLGNAISILQGAGFEVKGQPKRYKACGWTIKLMNNCAVIVYDKGGLQIVGKAQKQVEKAVKADLTACDIYNSKVFVVYGHDQSARDQLELLLHELDLTPLFLDRLPSEGKTIIEMLEKYIPQANYGIALLTPDDMGGERLAPDKLKPRARQNVILEVGMLQMKLSRKRVALVTKKTDEGLELPSDLDGIMRLDYKKDVREIKEKLMRELKDRGYHIN